MGRTLLGVIAGVITLWLTISALEFLGHAIFPPPPGLDPQDPEQLQQIIDAASGGALAMLVLAWTGGSFTGGWVAARIARHPRTAAVIIALLIMASVIGVSMMIPNHPKWVSALGVLLPIPTALVAAMLARRREKTLPA